MTLQATDASSTVATTTCSARVTVNATSTPTGVGAQIQALLAQIKALQAQILQLIVQNTGGGSTATSTPECFDFRRDLRHGDRGDDVKELQKKLTKEDPTLFPPGLITGFFGPKTEATLKMLQRRFGIDATGTGFFGHKSRGHFQAQCGNGDHDHDGVKNSDDADDDNDNTPDTDDDFPFNPHATSTSMKKGNHDGVNGKKGENGRSGHDNDEDDDE